MASMCDNEAVVHLHGYLGYGVSVDVNLWWHHTFLNDTSVYSALTNALSIDGFFGRRKSIASALKSMII